MHKPPPFAHSTFTKHLAIGTVETLTAACMMNPRFCKKFFRLELLLKIIQQSHNDLDLCDSLDTIRAEVVMRFLINSDRAKLRPRFLKALELSPFHDRYLEQFVETSYLARENSGADFRRAERKYLQKLKELAATDTKFRRPVQGAIRWFGCDRSRFLFRVLFSNSHLTFPDVIKPGYCLPFSLNTTHNVGNTNEGPFSGRDQRLLTDDFIDTARSADEMSHEITGRNEAFSYCRVDVEDFDIEESTVDGKSGYLAFLMAHLLRHYEMPISPYIGFTGAAREMGQLDRIEDLDHKIDAAIDGGMTDLFVPITNWKELSAEDQQGRGVLRIHPFQEGDTKQVAKLAFEIIKSQVPATISLSQGTSPIEKEQQAPRGQIEDAKSTPQQDSKTGDTSAKSDEPGGSFLRANIDNSPTVAERSKKLFRRADLKYFQEVGGSDSLHAAVCSVFNTKDRGFLTIFPEHAQLRSYESFGGLLQKFNAQSASAIAWSENANAYVIGYTERSQKPNIEFHPPEFDGPTRTLKTEHTVPRKIVTTDSGEVFVSDQNRSIAWFDSTGVLREQPISVVDIGYSPITDDILVVSPGVLRILAKDGQNRRYWKNEIRYNGDRAIVATGPDGDIYLAAAKERSGHFMRFRYKSGELAFAPVRSLLSPVGLVVLEHIVVAGSANGELLVFDHQGVRLGRDRLNVDLAQLAAGPGGFIVASTRAGPSVLIPQTLALVDESSHELREQSLQQLAALEKDFATGPESAAAARFLESVNLTRWPETLALQQAFLNRKKSDPARLRRIAAALKMLDARKADCLTTETKPAIIDGSNVSRDHYVNGSGTARLESIFAVQRELHKESSPVRYPIITVVDTTERHQTDNLPRLLQLLQASEMLEAPSQREADALILSLIRKLKWYDCEIISNDKKMWIAHQEMVPEVDGDWYQRVRRGFRVNAATNQVHFPPPSASRKKTKSSSSNGSARKGSSVRRKSAKLKPPQQDGDRSSQNSPKPGGKKKGNRRGGSK